MVSINQLPQTQPIEIIEFLPGDAITAAQPLAFGEVTEP